MKKPPPEFECYRCGFCCMQYPCDWGRGRMTDAELGQVYNGRGYCKFLKIDRKTFETTCLLMHDRKVAHKVRVYNKVGQGCIDWRHATYNGRITRTRLVNWMRARRIYWLVFGTVAPSKMTAAYRRVRNKELLQKVRKRHARVPQDPVGLQARRGEAPVLHRG